MPEQAIIPIPDYDKLSDQDREYLNLAIDKATDSYLRHNQLDWCNDDIVANVQGIVISSLQTELADQPAKWTTKEFSRRIALGLEKRERFIQEAEAIVTDLIRPIENTHMTKAQMLGFSPDTIEAARIELDGSLTQQNFPESTILHTEYITRINIHEELAVRLLSSTVGEHARQVHDDIVKEREQFPFESGVVKGIVLSGLLLSLPEKEERQTRINPFSVAPDDIYQLVVQKSYLDNDQLLIQTAAMLTRTFADGDTDKGITYEIFLSYLDSLTRRLKSFNTPVDTTSQSFWRKMNEGFGDIPHDPTGMSGTFIFDRNHIPPEGARGQFHLWQHPVEVNGYRIPSLQDLMLARRMLPKYVSHEQLELRDNSDKVRAALNAWMHFEKAQSVYPKRLAKYRDLLQKIDVRLSALDSDEVPANRLRQMTSLRTKIARFDDAKGIYNEAKVMQRVREGNVSPHILRQFLSIIARHAKEEMGNKVNARKRVISEMSRPSLLSLTVPLPHGFDVTPEISLAVREMEQRLARYVESLERYELPDEYLALMNSEELQTKLMQIEVDRGVRTSDMGILFQSLRHAYSPEERTQAMFRLLTKEVVRRQKLIADYKRANEGALTYLKVSSRIKSIEEGERVPMSDIVDLYQGFMSEERKLYYKRILGGFPLKHGMPKAAQYNEARSVLKALGDFSGARKLMSIEEYSLEKPLMDYKVPDKYKKIMDKISMYPDNPFLPNLLYEGQTTEDARNVLRVWLDLYEGRRKRAIYTKQLSELRSEHTAFRMAEKIAEIQDTQRTYQAVVAELEHETANPEALLLERIQALNWAIPLQ